MLLSADPDHDWPAIAEGDPLPPLDRAAPTRRGELDTLYREQRPRLLRFFARAVPAQAAQDLCQQLFLRLAGLPRDHAINNPAAYLHRSAANLAIDEYRRTENERIEVPLSDCDPPAPDQSAALEARDVFRRMEAVLAKLSPRTREIFLAHRLDGYSYGEIAARTGLGVKAVEKHMSRAIAKLSRLDPHR